MNSKRLNDEVLELIELKNELNGLTYNAANYDELEDDVCDFEDTFNLKYEKHLHPVLKKIHESLCPDVEVMVPSAYVAKCYTQSVVEDEQFEINPQQGLVVVTPDNRNARLSFYPNPLRVLFVTPKDFRVIWNAEQPETFNF